MPHRKIALGCFVSLDVHIEVALYFIPGVFLPLVGSELWLQRTTITALGVNKYRVQSSETGAETQVNQSGIP